MKEEDEIEFLTRWQRNVIAHNRLTDAAPELLAMLDNLSRSVRRLDTMRSLDLARQAELLVAKVKGETK